MRVAAALLALGMYTSFSPKVEHGWAHPTDCHHFDAMFIYLGALLILQIVGCAAIARADVADVFEEAAEVVEDATSSVESVVESVTSSFVEKPTFTVRSGD